MRMSDYLLLNALDILLRNLLGYLCSTRRQRTLDLRAITDLSGRTIRVMTGESVIAYPSVWPFSETRHF